MAEKGALLWAGEGCRLWAAEEPNFAVMTWEEPQSSRLAEGLDQVLRRHALQSHFVRRLDAQSLLVKRLEPLPMRAVARCEAGAVAIRFLGQGVGPTRLARMEDAATHAVRSLRAHLDQPFALTLRFGLAADGNCLLQVVDPLECEFGGTYAAVLAQLGGDSS